MKKIIAMLLTIILIVTINLTTTVLATNTTQTPTNEGWARIKYAENSRYLDIPAESFYDNGTQLQIWDYVYGNQNQIFYFHDTGDGWEISSHLTGKLIRVIDGSHDDYAKIVQDEKKEQECEKWYIIANDDNTVSFLNKESGLYLNVFGGGNAQNGTKMIQYHDDGTIAMRFYLEFMTYNDVLSATFNRTIYANDIEWNQFPQGPLYGNILNLTGLQYSNREKYYYPTPGQDSILDSIEYLSPNVVANMIKNKSYSKSTWKEIKSAVNGELSESAIASLLSRLGFGDIPGLGCALGILQVLLDSQESSKWNSFVDATQIDAQGRCSGVIVYTYYDIVSYSVWGPLNNGTTAWGTTYQIKKVPRVEYYSWTGDNFSDVCNLPQNIINGRWWYYFK